jgi:hypothetical protein
MEWCAIKRQIGLRDSIAHNLHERTINVAHRDLYCKPTRKRSPRSGSGAVRGGCWLQGDRPAVGGSDRQSDTTHRPKTHRTFQVACSERVHYANASRMGSSISRMRMYRVPCKHNLFGGLVHRFVAFDLRPIHTYHAVPMPCRSAKALDCVFPI